MKRTVLFMALMISLLSFIPLGAEIIRQQSFEENANDTWGFTVVPDAYYVGHPTYSIWDRDNEGIPGYMLPLPDADGEYIWNMEYTSYTDTCLHRFIFDTVDLSSYSGDLSAHFYYYTFVYGSSTGSWSGGFDSIGYYVEYDNGTEWTHYTPLNKGTNEWVQVSFDIPDTASYFRLCIVGKNDRNVEIAAFDYIYLLEVINEPTNHVSDLLLDSRTENSITVTWDDNDGAQPAQSFLVKIAEETTPATPVDGTEEFTSATTKRISPGVQTCTFSDLNAETSYSIRVFPYTNLDVFIDYKTDGTIPTLTASTLAADTPLPICMSSLSAARIREGVKVSWVTESETENAGFILYRDDEAIAYLEGAGNSTESLSYSYIDKNVVPGNTYTYTLADISYSNTETLHQNEAVSITIEETDIDATALFTLDMVYPNPFNPETKISYDVRSSGMLNMSIYNMSGEKVATLKSGSHHAGQYSLVWNAQNLPSGIYFLKASMGNRVVTKKLVLMK
jgi:hypothetical protein